MKFQAIQLQKKGFKRGATGRFNAANLQRTRGRATGTEKPQLKSTNLVVLDIDDDKGATDPAEVFQYAGARAMYYTFSHQETSVFKTKQNAYRFILKRMNR